MSEIEWLRQKALSYTGKCPYVENDNDPVRLKRLIAWHEKMKKLNKKEKDIEWLKVMKAADKIAGTNLYEIEKDLQDWLRKHPSYIYWHMENWENRGYRSNINCKNIAMIMKNKKDIKVVIRIPDWVNDELIKKHQQILLEKDYEHYSKYFR